MYEDISTRFKRVVAQIKAFEFDEGEGQFYKNYSLKQGVLFLGKEEVDLNNLDDEEKKVLFVKLDLLLKKHMVDVAIIILSFSGAQKDFLRDMAAKAFPEIEKNLSCEEYLNKLSLV